MVHFDIIASLLLVLSKSADFKLSTLVNDNSRLEFLGESEVYKSTNCARELWDCGHDKMITRKTLNYFRNNVVQEGNEQFKHPLTN